MEVTMEDIVQIRLLFVAGLLALSGMLGFVAYAIGRWSDRFRARGAERGRPEAVRRPTVKNVPLRGTR
jgi:hypothetical protein